MPGSVGFYVSSLSAYRAVEKLRRADIPVLSCREVQKNVLDLHIRAKDMKKGFAILQDSCYNIENIRYFGVENLRRKAIAAAGLLVGVLLFFGCVFFSESRVLKVEVVGSGAYYEREVRTILSEEGVGNFSAMPADTGRMTARLLALPRVEFCAFKKRGGVLTVEVQCSENIQPIAGMPLLSPVAGTIESLTVVRGTPLLNVGDAVEAGQTVVGDYFIAGENSYPSLVIARLTVRRTFSADYALSEEQALAQALLDFGEIKEVHTSKTSDGWHVEGVAFATVSLNLD